MRACTTSKCTFVNLEIKQSAQLFFRFLIIFSVLIKVPREVGDTGRDMVVPYEASPYPALGKVGKARHAKTNSCRAD